jgi:hypothetical protein
MSNWKGSRMKRSIPSKWIQSRSQFSRRLLSQDIERGEFPKSQPENLGKPGKTDSWDQQQQSGFLNSTAPNQ